MSAATTMQNRLHFTLIRLTCLLSHVYTKTKSMSLAINGEIDCSSELPDEIGWNPFGVKLDYFFPSGQSRIRRIAEVLIRKTAEAVRRKFWRMDNLLMYMPEYRQKLSGSQRRLMESLERSCKPLTSIWGKLPVWAQRHWTSGCTNFRLVRLS